MNNDAVGSDMNFALSGTLNFITILLFMLNSEVDMLISRPNILLSENRIYGFINYGMVLKRPQNITLAQPCLTGGVLFGL